MKRKLPCEEFMFYSDTFFFRVIINVLYKSALKFHSDQDEIQEEE